LLQSCVIVDRDDTAFCGGGHRLQGVDLNMSPEPVAEGQRINRWMVRLRADGTGECRTTVRIREDAGDDLVGQDVVYRLRPGINDIVIEPNERYHFTRKEHCFVVVADIAGTPRRVDASRRFCADQTGGRRWTMK
jgi:hypothetical protein